MHSNIKEGYILAAIIASASFLLSIWPAFYVVGELLIRISPSTSADDIRLDLILPLLGSVYIICGLVSYGVTSLAARFTYATFRPIVHVAFVFLIPLLFVVGYLLGAIVTFVFRFIPDQFVGPILFAYMMLAMSSGYYLLSRIIK